MNFEDLGLSDEIVQTVKDKGYEKPTPIQISAIPAIMQGRDVIGSAQTGTGKTAAFALPALSKLKPTGITTCLVLVPTRELAVQVEENFAAYGKNSGLRLALLYGGVGYGKQRQDLKAGADVIVATPGRLLDYMSQGEVILAKIEMLILDEVDRMLDMGFIDDVRRIVSKCPQGRQTLLFSATVPNEIQRLADWALTDPEVIDVGVRRAPAETVDHAVYPVDAIQKHDLLIELLERANYNSVIIFTRTKRDADRIAKWLRDHDHTVAVMHADRNQRERAEALEGFKSGKYPIMVATDLASRGLDVTNITHVINYNVPGHAEDYVHRIGRTGRAAREGEAYTLYSGDEHSYLREIEKFIEQPIERRKLEGFNYINEPCVGNPASVRTKNTGKRNSGANRGFKQSVHTKKFSSW